MLCQFAVYICSLFKKKNDLCNTSLNPSFFLPVKIPLGKFIFYMDHLITSFLRWNEIEKNQQTDLLKLGSVQDTVFIPYFSLLEISIFEFLFKRLFSSPNSAIFKGAAHLLSL